MMKHWIAFAGSALLATSFQAHAQAAQAVMNAADRLQEREFMRAQARVLDLLDRDACGRSPAVDALRSQVSNDGRRLTPADARRIKAAVEDAGKLRSPECPLADAIRPFDAPAAFAPGVAFTMNATVDQGAADRGGVQAGVLFETTLMGAVAASAFGALDSNLGDYLKKNLSTAIGIPGSGRNKLFNTVSVALGKFAVAPTAHSPGAEFYPAISLTDADASDKRIPASLASDTSRKSWSMLRIHLAIAFTGACENKLQGCHLPVLYLTGSAPQYYPGTAYEGVAALFNDGRAKYRNEGKWRFGAGFAVALDPIQRGK